MRAPQDARPSHVVDLSEAARMLSLSRATLYRQLHLMPPRVRLSTRRFGFRVSDLEAWIEQRREPVPS